MTTIALTKDARERVKEFGNKGESYSEIIEKLMKSAKERQLHDLLFSEEDTITAEKALSKAKKNAWNAMHSYTHGGLHQISRKIKASTIESDIDNEEIEEIICFAELIGSLSFSAMIEMSKPSGKDDVVEKIMESVSKECFNKPLAL